MYLPLVAVPARKSSNLESVKCQSDRHVKEKQRHEKTHENPSHPSSISRAIYHSFTLLALFLSSHPQISEHSIWVALHISPILKYYALSRDFLDRGFPLCRVQVNKRYRPRARCVLYARNRLRFPLATHIFHIFSRQNYSNDKDICLLQDVKPYLLRTRPARL